MVKFEYNIDFQWEILRFTLTDKYGYKVVGLYKPQYFDLEEQKLIAHGLQRYYKRKNSIPRSAPILNEELRRLFKTKEYVNKLLEADRTRIFKKVRALYSKKSSDPSEVVEKIRMFSSYTQLKKILEGIDLSDYNQYEHYSKNIQKAVNFGIDLDENRGTFVVGAHRIRLAGRKNREAIIPTPFSQINRLTNAGGYTKGSIVVVIDIPKGGKTAVLINIAAQYMTTFRRKAMGDGKLYKKVIYFDLENGEEAISTRIDQCLMGKTKKEIISGRYDEDIKKKYRKYRRLGSEIFTIRMPARSTTADFQGVLDEIYEEYGILFEIAIIDYIGLMGSLSGKVEDESRISEAYVDVKNFANKNDFDAVFTGHHIKRDGYKRRATVYQSDDLAKCIEIARHVDAIYGFQQSSAEEKKKIARLEIIDQRDGPKFGRAYFNVDFDKQRVWEFTNEQLELIERAQKTKGDL